MPRNLPASAFFRLLVLAGVGLLLSACASIQQNPAEVLSRASQSMGADKLRTVGYATEGIGYTFGQAFSPGGAWPKIDVHSMIRTIDYDGAAMREQIVLSRAEPLGGGGYPLSGRQTNDQYISGDIAWNQIGKAVLPGPRWTADRIHQLWITPHGVLKAAMRNPATARAGADGAVEVSFTESGRFRATVTIDARGLVTRVDSIAPDAVLGDTRTVTTYSDYREFSGIRFPGRIQQTMGGFPVLDVAVKEVWPNIAATVTIPDAARNQGERVVAEKAADGIWYLAGASHHSVLIEQKDHLVLVEAPLGDPRTQAVIDQAKKLVPGKPIRYLVNSHAHFDHSGGLRTAAAEGATIVTQAGNVPFLERALATPNSVRPDALARSGKRASFRAVGERLDIGDGTRPIELHRLTAGPHNDGFLMVYLPRERLLIQADAFTPGAPGAPVPAVPNANHVSLVNNIERLKLPVDRILPLHGRIVPLSDLYAAVGRPSATR